MSTTSIHFISLGCARNLVDTEVMAGLLNRDGYRIIGNANEADVIVVNTCGFIDSAKKESVETILEAAEYKKNKCQKLVVAGCLAERYPGELRDSIPEVDLVMGTGSFTKIVAEIEKMNLHSPSASNDIDGKARIVTSTERLKDYDLPRMNSQPFYTAYLKLAEGCAKRCSFCIIPDLRGPLRSRSVEALVQESRDLVASGVRELNLIAQDLTDYGRDRKDGANLAGLLRELVKVKDLEWIRLFYAYPDQLSDDVIDMIAGEEKICHYLDVPIQHMSTRMLERMNRKNTGEGIQRMIEKLKQRIPDIAIRTSLMVGFPGETDEDFEALLRFVEQGWLDQAGIFTYSHEEGTPSFKKFDDDVPSKIKQQRQKTLYAAQERVLKQRLQGFLNKELTVLIEGAHDETDLLLKSRHFGQGPGVDNLTLINSGTAEVGTFRRARVTDIAGIDLVAELLD